MTASAEEAILDLLAVQDERSMAPEAVARRLAGEGWRTVLPQVRAAAVSLARQGRINILRHGRAVDPEAFKGVYRLGRVREG